MKSLETTSNVLIVSKTKMQHGVCVGGITEEGRFVRLLDENGHHPVENTAYEIKQIWEMMWLPGTRPVPHTEDVRVLSKKHNGILPNETSILDFINSKKIPIYRGSIVNLFESKLQFPQSGGIGFITKENVPQNSVCFWIADKYLVRKDCCGKIRYNYNDGRKSWGYNMAYVGLEKPIVCIPAGTLIRMSLANWWHPKNSNQEDRCYLQLSGWYDI